MTDPIVDKIVQKLYGGSIDPLHDPRVKPEKYAVYPTGYDDYALSDKDGFVLTVVNGHEWGWSVREGLYFDGHRAMNRKGKMIMESRGNRGNRFRRYPLDEALELALKYVDTLKRGGRTLQEWEDHFRDRESTPDS